ncbi:MAG: hypothetical protein H6Q06_1559, partial [Acidobacteria bacterium]|nr:hypothetical protein [Acidobacteriota bacterium]
MFRHSNEKGRRGFLQGILAGTGLAVAAPSGATAQSTPGSPGGDFLPPYARAHSYRSRKQSSHDPSGGNRDFWPIRAGATQELFNQKGP